jgi:hypothetical protein
VIVGAEGGCVGKIIVGVEVPVEVAVRLGSGVTGGNGVIVGVEGGCVGIIFVDVEVIGEVAVKLGSGVTDGNTVGMFFCPPQAVRNMQTTIGIRNVFFIPLYW